MKLKSKSIFSMKDANQNFSKVARAIDEIGEVVIYKYNKPCYIMVPYKEELDKTDHDIQELVEITVQQ